MALRDVNTTVSDGLLGFATEKGTGVFVATGASPVEAETPVIITGNMGVGKIRERLGLSPLADSVMDSVENGANRIYCIPVKASVDGAAGEVKKEGTGGGSCTVSGKPYNRYDVVVRITGKGGLNSGLFTYSIDGGFSGSEEITLPMTGEFEIPGTGLTLTFTEASNESSDFEIGDVFSFTTTAPQMNNADALGAVEKLRYFSELYEFVHIVGESTPAMAVAVSAAQAELETVHHKPLAFIMEAGAPGENEKVEDYALRLEAERKQIKNIAIAIVAARGLYVKMDGTTRKQNLAGLPLLQDDIDVEDTQGELERRAKYMEAPLDEMERNKEISSAQITVPEGQDIIGTEKMSVTVRYISRGYIREIDVDLGRANISITEA